MKHIFSFLFLFSVSALSFSQNGFTHLFREQAPFPVITNSRATLVETIDSCYMSIYNRVDTGDGTNLILTKMN